jgi:hypothetical protein
MIFKETVAEAIYEAYCAAVGGVAFNGDVLPDWAAFVSDPSKADAWLAAADRAIQFLD